MKHSKLLLATALSLSLHSICYATIVGGVVDPGSTLVALLGPGSDNSGSREGAREGAITVTTPSGTVAISRAGFATIISPGAPPTPPAPLTPAQIQQLGRANAGTGANGGTLTTGGTGAVTVTGATGGTITTAGTGAVTVTGATGGTVATVGTGAVTVTGATGGTVATVGTGAGTVTGATGGTVTTAGIGAVTVTGATGGTVTTAGTGAVTVTGATGGTIVATIPGAGAVTVTNGGTLTAGNGAGTATVVAADPGANGGTLAIGGTGAATVTGANGGTVSGATLLAQLPSSDNFNEPTIISVMQATSGGSGSGSAYTPPLPATQALFSLVSNGAITASQTDYTTTVALGTLADLPAAQFFFNYGQNKTASQNFTDGGSPSDGYDSLIWGNWAQTPVFGPYTQTIGLGYHSDAETPPSSIIMRDFQGTATYNGTLNGSVTYGNNSVPLITDITLTADFGQKSLNTVPGSAIALKGGWSQNSSAVSGTISYNGALSGVSNTSKANLSGNFYGSFFGENADKIGAAWAMHGTVGATNSTAAGIITATKNGPT